MSDLSAHPVEHASPLSEPIGWFGMEEIEKSREPLEEDEAEAPE